MHTLQSVSWIKKVIPYHQDSLWKYLGDFKSNSCKYSFFLFSFTLFSVYLKWKNVIPNHPDFLPLRLDDFISNSWNYFFIFLHTVQSVSKMKKSDSLTSVPIMKILSRRVTVNSRATHGILFSFSCTLCRVYQQWKK